MTEAQRRRSRRYPTDWYVQFRFRPDAPWRSCRIVEVSEHGATVELHDLEPGESFGARIDLEVTSLPQDAIGIVLGAQIRHRRRQPDGLVIGVEFTPTGTDRINLLRLLVGMRSLAADA